jgi:cell division protein FtsQ
VTSKSYTNRTTLWDDQDPTENAAPQTRGAWRAPSAVLASDRGRRAASVMPVVTEEELEERAPAPRRARFTPARTPWWRPRSTFGRILLGGAAFILLSMLITAGILTRRFLIRDPHFRIVSAASIQSSGLSEVNRTEVLPVFGEDIGRNIFFVPLSQRRKQLEAIPWVQQATVMRFLPDHLRVSIVERTPVAFVREGGRVELADADGVILSMPPVMMAQHHYSFPVITGIDARDSLASRRARMAVYQRFMAELDQNNEHLADQVSEIDLSDLEDLRATMPEQGSDMLAHFGDSHFIERLHVYKTHVAEWRQRYPKLIGVDLRYSDNVPLEMANDGGPSTTTQISATVSEPVKAAKPVLSNAEKMPQKSVPAAKAEATQRQTAKSTPSPTTKATPSKASLAAHKAAEARKRAARLKAERAKAARERAASHATTHTVPAQGKQGQ